MNQTDTAPAVERRWVERLREMNEAQRAQAAFRLTDQVRALVWAAVRRAHPEAGEHELRCQYAEQVYGPEVATRVRKWRR